MHGRDQLEEEKQKSQLDRLEKRALLKENLNLLLIVLELRNFQRDLAHYLNLRECKTEHD